MAFLWSSMSHILIYFHNKNPYSSTPIPPHKCQLFIEMFIATFYQTLFRAQQKLQWKIFFFSLFPASCIVIFYWFYLRQKNCSHHSWNAQNKNQSICDWFSFFICHSVCLSSSKYFSAIMAEPQKGRNCNREKWEGMKNRFSGRW